MKSKDLQPSALHDIPDDMREALLSSEEIREKWNDLTPIARNEWICWTTSVKKDETRKEHIERLCEDLLKGKRRPCCWPGCPHRNPKAAKWFGEKVTEHRVQSDL